MVKYVTMVGKAVELAGMMPEISKLNMTIESKMVISIELTKSSSLLTLIDHSYAASVFLHCQAEEEIPEQS